MDSEVQRRIEKLEKVVSEDDIISKLERKTIRVGMLVIVSLTLLLIIVSKLSELVHAISVAWHSVME
jgi:hypothetical protein